jgi:hypothetical protein
MLQARVEGLVEVIKQVFHHVEPSRAEKVGEQVVKGDELVLRKVAGVVQNGIHACVEIIYDVLQ